MRNLKSPTPTKSPCNNAPCRQAAARALVALGMSCLFGVVGSGCGQPVDLDFDQRLIGSDGQLFTLDDIEAIVDDPDLSTDEKRAALRSLGIEDEQLIDALLTL